jgi:hypothetical protein
VDEDLQQTLNFRFPGWRVLGPLPPLPDADYLSAKECKSVRLVYVYIGDVAAERMSTFLLGSTERLVALFDRHVKFTLCLQGTNAQTPAVLNADTHKTHIKHKDSHSPTNTGAAGAGARWVEVGPGVHHRH